MFLEISRNSLENACAIVSILIKLQAWDLRAVNFAKFLRTLFYRTNLGDCVCLCSVTHKKKKTKQDTTYPALSKIFFAYQSHAKLILLYSNTIFLFKKNHFYVSTSLLYSFVSMLFLKRAVKSLVWIIR